MDQFWLAFIPLFVALDAVGLLPIYWALAQGIPADQRRQAVRHAILVGFFVACAFLVVSKSIFVFLGIAMADVMIAGGIILFVLTMNELLRPEKISAGSIEALGVVPLGVPLIVGPAVLTTVLLLRERYGVWPTVASLSVNILVVWGVLEVADGVMERIGRDGAKVISKVFGLILAAFAVMLVRQGVMASGLVAVAGAGIAR